MRGAYRQFDHTGDIGVEAEAPDEGSLYACCAAALFDIIAEPDAAHPSAERLIEITAPDREVLLVHWLRELLYLHDAERWIFRDFEVETGGASDGGRWLKGAARGDTFDPARHTIRTEIKAVTYHQASVRRDPDGTWRARLVLDI